MAKALYEYIPEVKVEVVDYEEMTGAYLPDTVISSALEFMVGYRSVFGVDGDLAASRGWLELLVLAKDGYAQNVEQPDFWSALRKRLKKDQ